MYIQQLYTNCLSEAAYYIESNGEAAIIDPLRDIDQYLQLAKERKASIKYIFETHFHADFVSGHIDLNAATNAPIIYGPEAKTSFKSYNAIDNEEFQLGNITMNSMHTPGHTLESTCYLLFDENKKEHAIFTGDTLFVGDVGRPDLFEGVLDKDDLAGMMYDSLQSKILTLPDDVIVYPAHGAGSSCGKNIGKKTFSTIGEQKKNNYALQPQTKEEFIKAVTDSLAKPPAYFSINAKINKVGYDSLEVVLQQSLQALSVNEFKTQANNDAIILDTRDANIFTEGFVPNSIFIGLEGRFAEFVGTLIPFNKPILLVCDEDKIQESIVRLARVGYDNVIGYLNGGLEAWKKAGEKTDLIINIEADELAMDLKFDENISIIDVRKTTEFDADHIKNAQNKVLQQFNDPFTLADLEEDINLYIHCAGGYRSVIACSIIKLHGFHNLRNIVGGFAEIKKISEIETEATKVIELPKEN